MKLVLSDIPVGSSVKITGIFTMPALEKRLRDIGLIDGTEVKVLHQSPPGDPRAYLIRGTVIALRNSDACCIEVTTEK